MHHVLFLAVVEVLSMEEVERNTGRDNTIANNRKANTIKFIKTPNKQ